MRYGNRKTREKREVQRRFSYEEITASRDTGRYISTTHDSQTHETKISIAKAIKSNQKQSSRRPVV